MTSLHGTYAEMSILELQTDHASKHCDYNLPVD